MITTQAQRLKDALKAAGFKYGGWRTRGEFTVRTEGSGSSPQGFGDALASVSGDASYRLLLKATELASYGVEVRVTRLDDYRMYVTVGSGYQRVSGVRTVDFTKLDQYGLPEFGFVEVEEKEV